jgi:putative DNA methylase
LTREVPACGKGYSYDVTEEAQDAERRCLFRFIEDLVLWENTMNEKVLGQAREGIRIGHREEILNR